MPDIAHPDQALYSADARPFPVIPACDHYAGTEATMTKALARQAAHPGVFDVTLDLEDGAPTGAEADHADLVVQLLNGEGNARGRAGARVHDHGSPFWRSDVEVLLRGAGARLAHLTIPKVEGARQLAEMVDHVQRTARACGLERPVPIHVLIETHGALAELDAIAATPWLRGLDFGIMDFVSAHHGAIGAEAMRSPLQFEHALVRRAKTLQVAAALAHGLVPVHGVTLALRDTEQVAADATRARDEFGYLRMWSIHPAQIDPILAAFAPRHEALVLAAEVLLAGRAARWAPVAVGETLYDRASYRYHWTVLRRARLAGEVLPDEAEAAFFAGT